jgi:hypothetical protein
MGPPEASPEAVVQRQLDAYNARDLDAFVACYSPDAQLGPLRPSRRTPRAFLATVHGRLRRRRSESLRATYERLFSAAPELQASVSTRVVQGKYVIDHEHVTGQPRGPFTAVAIYEVEDGLISRVWFID